MGYGIRARRRGFVTAGHTTAITGSGTRTFVSLGVPNGVTKLTVWMIGGGGGAGGGCSYDHGITAGATSSYASAGGGGSGYVREYTITINALDTFSYQCGTGGWSGLSYEYDDIGQEPPATQTQTAGGNGNPTTLAYKGTTYSAGGGYASASTGTAVKSGANATNGASGGSGGGGGGVDSRKDTTEWYAYLYSSIRGAGGQNGGSGSSSTRDPDTINAPTLRSGGSGEGRSTRPFGISAYQCGAGGNSHSALRYGDGAEGNYSNLESRRQQANSGAIFFSWNNGGV